MKYLYLETNLNTVGSLLDYIGSQEDYIPEYKESKESFLGLGIGLVGFDIPVLL
jgi:hypothetical protein